MESHTPTALLPLPTEKGAGWAPESVIARIETPDHYADSTVPAQYTHLA